MKLNKSQKELLANGLKDLANLSVLGLVFGYLNAVRWEPYFSIAGLFLYGFFNLAALYLIRGGDE
ncbi:MAG: hypothetical protein HZA78_03010 [Candidatus Schekmanbacteria bacterium]|nr:hypothetical protein [Candidatus Schekmanbacteria bacterium]